MSHGTCPTVKVDDGNGGYYLINATDFDDTKHTKHGEKPKARRARKPKAD